ncbi:MAG: hypothetical protein ACRERD_29425 [Candidatus Binatia bacterium]
MLLRLEDLLMDILKLAWKFVSFYDLPPQTLLHLSQTYGLTGLGSIVGIRDATALARARHHFQVVLEQEPDPRVQRCVTHQFSLADKAFALRAQGLQARVRGWLVVIDGGKKKPSVTSRLRPPAIRRPL